MVCWYAAVSRPGHKNQLKKVQWNIYILDLLIAVAIEVVWFSRFARWRMQIFLGLKVGVFVWLFVYDYYI